MQPKNWYKYSSNLSQSLRHALSLAATLPSKGVGIYSQDKSSRICFASLSKTNDKVDVVLSDTSKYKPLRKDMAVIYQPKIKSWYRKYKPVLSQIPDDISNYLVPENVSTPHLKVMIKTHKKDCPVRLTFSSQGSCTSHLSTVLDASTSSGVMTHGLMTETADDTSAQANQ